MSSEKELEELREEIADRTREIIDLIWQPGTNLPRRWAR